MSNFDAWSKDLERQFEERLVQRFVQKHRAITIDALKDISTDSMRVGFSNGSPVWTGRFKGSNNVSIGAPDTSTLPPHPETAEGLRWPDAPDSPYKSPSLAEASIKLTGLKPFEKTYITNALPYARRIEEGYSPKAPEGVYEVTAERMVAKYAGTKL